MGFSSSNLLLFELVFFGVWDCAFGLFCFCMQMAIYIYIYIYIYISDKVKSIAEKFRGSISTLKYIYRPASEIVKKLTTTQMVSSHHITKVCSDQKGGARVI